ncbi:MAG: sigma-70 family RNA polymerase sigma factor [Ignavibacteriae bacterium]|nr:sigma-70 family RNA polymerase sigma factor [Ignavibacteriota bacterium]
MIESDVEIVQQCLNGHKNAFRFIVQRYHKTIFNAAFRILNDYDDATEVTQSVFVKAYENLYTFNKRYKFFSWLYRIAVNESLNFLGQRKHTDEVDESIISRDKTPYESYDDLEIQDKIQNALMRLNLDYRVVIVLCHFQDLSYKEISYVLDIPEKTVKSRLFTARQLLRGLLMKEGFTI